jgi:cytochrome b561
VLYGPIHLPAVAPHSDALYAILRATHTWLVFILFRAILLHLGAALFYALLQRDGVFERMASLTNESKIDQS